MSTLHPAVIEWLVPRLVSLFLKRTWWRQFELREAGQIERATLYLRRFDGLVAATDCWPCLVQWSTDYIWVLWGAEAEAAEREWDGGDL